MRNCEQNPGQIFPTSIGVRFHGQRTWIVLTTYRSSQRCCTFAVRLSTSTPPVVLWPQYIEYLPVSTARRDHRMNQSFVQQRSQHIGIDAFESAQADPYHSMLRQNRAFVRVGGVGAGYIWWIDAVVRLD
jgi:hypothetical protein